MQLRKERIIPEVGEPFLSRWKAYITERLQHEHGSPPVPAAAKSGTASALASKGGRKRKQEGSTGVWINPPSQTKEARIERLAKARRLMSTSQPSAVEPPLPAGLGTGPLRPPGVIT